MDIGSIFPIYEEDENNNIFDEKTINENFLSKRIFLSLCRECILLIIKLCKKSKKVVLLPSYTCHTVYDPFVQENWKCFFYPITRDLRIDCQKLKEMIKELKPSLVLAHEYYGNDFSNEEIETLKFAQLNECLIINDLTQNIFSKKRDTIFSFFIGSVRKYAAIPDGGFIEFNNEEDYSRAKEILKGIEFNDYFYKTEYEAMKLRAKFFALNDPKIRQESNLLDKEAVDFSNGRINLHNISDYSKKHMYEFYNPLNEETRKRNYLFLHYNIVFNENIKPVYTNILEEQLHGSLYYPIFCEERQKVKECLESNNIYPAILWSVVNRDVLVNDDVKYIYNHILLLPCANIYDINQMTKIINILKSCL